MTRFKPVWKCWSCGAKLDSGERLDCEACEKSLWDAKKWAEKRHQEPPRIVARVVDYSESNGVIAMLRKELEGIII